MTDAQTPDPAPQPKPAPRLEKAPPQTGMKPYLRWSSLLFTIGVGLLTFEERILKELNGFFNGALDPNLLGVVALLPVLMVVVGAIIFIVGRMRRL